MRCSQARILVWFCSDNGGLKVTPESVNALRGLKGSVYEGGLRVPAIIEWPSVITKAAISNTPAGVVDIFPTLADLVGLPKSAMLQPQDGSSLKLWIEGSIPARREKPIGFRYMNAGAMVDNHFKLVTQKLGSGEYELYDLAKDPKESKNLYTARPEVAKRLTAVFEKWSQSVDASDAGKDYPEGHLTDPNPRRMFWTDLPDYEPYFDEWKKRPEYASRLKDK